MEDLAQIEAHLMQARRILAVGRPTDGQTWMLVATLVGEADLALQTIKKRNPMVNLPLLDDVVRELYEMTAGFTAHDFLQQTKAARRQNPRLFC